MADPFPPAIPLPPSAIPFPLSSSSRHVNTGFGFGSFGSSSPAYPAGPSSGGLGFGFGTPYKRPAVSPSPSLGQFGHTPASNGRKKRQLSPADDEEMVDADALPSGGRRRELKSLAKGKKRVRGEARADADGVKEVKKEEEGLDLGVLLASLPASSHLSLILSLISSQPSIKPLLLSLIPQLDLNQCMETLETKLRAVEATVPITASSATRLGFGFGSQTAVAPAAKERDELYVWNRVKGGVAEYCSMASTYLNFFLPVTAPPSRAPSEPNTVHNLLHTLTTHLFRLLPLVPSSASLVDSTKATLEQFSHAINTAWRRWITDLSAEVNQRGGMYPASRVAAWGDSLDQLATQRLEFAEIRDVWVREVGWLIGRRPVQAW